MANAKKCDRCGKFYLYKDKLFRIKRNRMLDTLRVQDENDNTIEYFDLCDTCAEELWNWLNIVKEDQSEC